MIPLLRPVPIVRFGMGVNSPWRMAEGAMSAPALAPGSLSVLQSGVDKIIDSLSTEIQALVVEADLVSPSAVRVDPNSASEISNIGNLPPQEIRSAISASAQQLSSLVDRVTAGALGPYVTSSQATQLSTLKGQADQVNSAVQNQDTTPISPGDQGAVQAYLDSHASGPTAAIADSEKGVVTAEAGSVPVLEPSEKDIGLKIAIGVGLTAVVGLVLWHVLG